MEQVKEGRAYIREGLQPEYFFRKQADEPFNRQFMVSGVSSILTTIQPEELFFLRRAT